MGLKPGLALAAAFACVAAGCAVTGCGFDWLVAREACAVWGCGFAVLGDALAAGRAGSSGCVGVVSVSVSKSPECVAAGAAVVAATAGAGSGVGVTAVAGAIVGVDSPIAWRNDARA